MARTDFDQDPMTVATAVVERFNSRDFDGIIEDGGGAVDDTEVGTGRRITDPDEFLAALRAWVTALPDVRGTVLSAMRDGDRMCVEIHWQGTHSGPLATPSGTLPAERQPHSRPGPSSFFTIRDGRILDMVHYLDMMTMTQIVAVPSASAHQPAGARG